MPRRAQKRNLKSKQQLQFVQAPLNGASHSYGPKVRGARNPKIHLSEEPCQSSTAPSWVTPQFDSSMMSRTLHARRRRAMKKSSNRSVLDSSSLLCLPRHRKASVCKFPALPFQKHAGARHPDARHGEMAKLGGVGEVNRTSDPVGRGPSWNPNAGSVPCLGNRTVEDAGVLTLAPATVASRAGRANEALDCTINTPVGRRQPSFTDSGFTPPDIDTPDVLQASRSCSATQESRLSKLRLLFPQTPLQAPPPPVLVSDTPEEHYGRSWRRSQLSFL